MNDRRISFSVFLTRAEVDKLHALAVETDRTSSAIFRRLLTLSDLPEAKALLGIEPIAAPAAPTAAHDRPTQAHA
jgi:hypothetical protein